MRLLQITNKPLYPPDDGSSIAMYQMSSGFLQNDVQLKLICINTKKHFKPDEGVEAAFKKSSRYESVYRNTDVTALGAFLNLFSKRSYFVSRFYFKAFERKLIAVLQENTFDVIQLESVFLGNYIPLLRKYSRAKISIRTHNTEHLIWERMLVNEKNFLKKIYLSLQTKRLRKFEKEVLHSVDAIVPITAIDQVYFKNWGIQTPCHVSPTGIQPENYLVNHSEELAGSVFHFGSMDWMPNEEAVLWFVNQVWDKVLKELPLAKFYIIGRGQGRQISQLNKPHVVLVGKTENAEKVYHRYDVMVVPLLSGSGMRIKMIEGMAYGKAIVSTRIGAEGIAVRSGKECILADDPDRFAQAVIALLKDKNQKERLQKEARSFIEQHFENKTLVKKLIDFYQTL